MRVLSGLEIRDFIKVRQLHQARALRQHFKVIPKVAIINTSQDQLTNSYAKYKEDYGRDVDIEVAVYNINQSEASSLIEQLNVDSTIKGIVLQLPLSDVSQTDELISLIDPKKDIDNLSGSSPWDSPAGIAINWLLASYNVDLKNKTIAIIGNDRLVSESLFRMWSESGYNVTGRADLSDLTEFLIDKDIIVTATGVSGIIKSDMLHDGVVVVDAGVLTDSWSKNGEIDPSVRDRKDLTLTPEKGGVGALVIGALMDNVIQASYPK